MKLTGINQLWVADITYIRLRAEFVYLTVVLDEFSRNKSQEEVQAVLWPHFACKAPRTCVVTHLEIIISQHLYLKFLDIAASGEQTSGTPHF